LTRRLSICQPTLCGTDLAEDVAIAKAAGVDALAMFEGRLAGTHPRDVRASFDRAGITASTYVYFGRAVDHAEDPEALAEGEARIMEAAALGATGLLVVSGPLRHRTITEADDLCRRWFTTMAPFAAGHGVRLLFEPLHPVRRSFTYVHRLAHALDIINGVENVFAVVDTGHLWWDVDLVGDVRANIGKVGLVQFTNVDTGALMDGRLDRTGLEGDVPLAELLHSFDDAGYSGYYEFEGAISLTGPARGDYVRSVREWFEGLWG
jgi:sugar phosphate isomerase/epimerase